MQNLNPFQMTLSNSSDFALAISSKLFDSLKSSRSTSEKVFVESINNSAFYPILNY